MATVNQHGIVPREFSIFAGLDVDKKRIAVTFSDHERVLKSLQMPYSSRHLVGSRKRGVASIAAVCPV